MVFTTMTHNHCKLDIGNLKMKIDHTLQQKELKIENYKLQINNQEDFLKFIKKNDSDYLSRSSDGHFWYNPGRKGDLSKYLEQFQDLIEIEKASNYFWNSQTCKILRVNEIGKFSSRNFQWRKMLDTYFSLVAVNKENFRETVNQSVEILNSIPQPNQIKNYRNQPKL